jgi:hypothetical protein
MPSIAKLRREVARLEAEQAWRRLEVSADPVEFAKACGLEPDGWQREVLRSKSKRILLNCSRQSGKTTTVAALALHRAFYVPRSFCLIFAPSLDQSLEFFRRITDLCRGLGMQSLEAESLRKTGMDLKNGSRIEARPGSEKTARSRSADLLVIDEAARIDDELYHSVRPMLIATRGALVMLSTPYGRRGVFHHEWEKDEGWERYRIDACQCPRISEEDLEAERRALPERVFLREYMCEFAETEGQVFSEEGIQAMFLRGQNIEALDLREPDEKEPIDEFDPWELFAH